MKVKALVAVRSGSQRVVDKNIRPFAGSNLLSIKIDYLHIFSTEIRFVRCTNRYYNYKNNN